MDFKKENKTSLIIACLILSTIALIITGVFAYTVQLPSSSRRDKIEVETQITTTTTEQQLIEDQVDIIEASFNTALTVIKEAPRLLYSLGQQLFGPQVFE